VIAQRVRAKHVRVELAAAYQGNAAVIEDIAFLSCRSFMP
jgi:hypothetical protein